MFHVKKLFRCSSFFVFFTSWQTAVFPKLASFRLWQKTAGEAVLVFSAHFQKCFWRQRIQNRYFVIQLKFLYVFSIKIFSIKHWFDFNANPLSLMLSTVKSVVIKNAFPVGKLLIQLPLPLFCWDQTFVCTLWVKVAVLFQNIYVCVWM